jgi:hypothetical protein
MGVHGVAGTLLPSGMQPGKLVLEMEDGSCMRCDLLLEQHELMQQLLTSGRMVPLQFFGAATRGRCAVRGVCGIHSY